MLTLYNPGATLAFQMPMYLPPDVCSRLVLVSSPPSGAYITAVHLKMPSEEDWSDAFVEEAELWPAFLFEPICTYPSLRSRLAKPWGEPNPQVAHPLTVSFGSWLAEELAEEELYCDESVLSVLSWKDAVMVVASPDLTGLGWAETSASS